MWLLPASARRGAGALLFAAFWASLAITPGDAARPAGQPQNEFVVGAILDLAGGWTSLGRASRVTLELATADANAALARRGAPLRVRLHILDARGEPALALHQLRLLREEWRAHRRWAAEEQRSRRHATCGDEPRRACHQPRKHGAFACGG